MIKPILHLNGSSFPNLERQLEDILESLEAALEVMRHATPHARDYYPGGDGLYSEARRQHERRYENLMSLHDEFTAQHLALIQDHEDSQPGRLR